MLIIGQHAPGGVKRHLDVTHDKNVGRRAAVGLRSGERRHNEHETKHE
jgi:hypothetical protein